MSAFLRQVVIKRYLCQLSSNPTDTPANLLIVPVTDWTPRGVMMQRQPAVSNPFDAR